MSEIFNKYEIGQRIRKCREAKKIKSQEDLAEILNAYSEKNNIPISKRFNREDIKRWENGDQDLKMSVLFLLSRVLEEDCNYILTGTKSKFAIASNQLGFTQKTLMKISEASDPENSSSIRFGNWNDQINFIFDHDLEFVLNELLHYWDFCINGNDHLERHIKATNSRNDVEMIITDIPEESDHSIFLLNQLIIQGFSEDEAVLMIKEMEKEDTKEREIKIKSKIDLLNEQGKTKDEALKIIQQEERLEKIHKEEENEFIQRLKLFKLEKAIDKGTELLQKIKKGGSENGKAR